MQPVMRKQLNLFIRVKIIFFANVRIQQTEKSVNDVTFFSNYVTLFGIKKPTFE
jgi:hypothetical protein